MKSSLKTLTRIQKFSIDEQRKKLVEWQTREEKAIQAIKKLNDDFAAEKEFASQNPGLGDFGAYTKRYIKKREAKESELGVIRRKIAEIRDIIADMFKEQKTYEIVDQNRAAREQKEIDNKNQKMLDEIGTNTYIKKHKPE